MSDTFREEVDYGSFDIVGNPNIQLCMGYIRE